MNTTRKYRDLGLSLKMTRLRVGESIQNIADLLGVDRTMISKFENGHERPTERALNQLISHFSLNNDEALTLWRQAGYTSGLIFAQSRKDGNNKYMKQPNNLLAPMPQAQPGGMNVSIDAASKPTIYTNMAAVYSDDVGLTIDFAQSVGPTGQYMVQTRVGMSKDQARKLIDVLKANLGIE